MAPRFIYFDLGQVLVTFDYGRMLRQVAEVAGIDPSDVEKVIFASGLQSQYERGQITTAQFYEAFCQRTGTRPPLAELEHAASDFFELNTSIVPVVAQVWQAGYRPGVLSNTCDLHWHHCRREFALVRETFDVCVLSYEVGAAKPEPAIYAAAIERAGCRPEEIFFTDDIAGHVLGAQAAGIDAVQYTSTPALVDALRARGVELSY